ncbi:MAG: L-aspartate oxidase [Chloroflexi bacterium]|nr:L-aspartate oxidase [Chloroflexota bacterium]
MSHFDYVIIGSGIAGLYSALLAERLGTVLVLTKSRIDECNTRHAQGGIAAPIGADDSPGLHLQDTLAAGAGLVNDEAARILAEEALDRINDLIRFGVAFDTLEGEIVLGREGAHSVARVLHAGGDATGAQIEQALSQRVLASKVQVLEHHLVTDVLVDGGRVSGVRVLDCQCGDVRSFSCRYLIVASGGAGQLFKITTNPIVATGDGVALAFRAGAEVADMEFYQFHPTALSVPGLPHFLISEAVRGEGAYLRNEKGERFMLDHHPLGELAPRDVVSRAEHAEMQKSEQDHVYLDVTHLPRSKTISRFPSIYRFCLDHGIDITSDLIPVAPAAHYMIGGVRTNVLGETNIRGLYACGEVACTGVHGANRLASNSLLETIVFAKRIVDSTVSGTTLLGQVSRNSPEPKIVEIDVEESQGAEDPRPSLAELQELMWENVGIIRDRESLGLAVVTLRKWIASHHWGLDRESLELRNLLLVGLIAGKSALLRTESRGAHTRSDYPMESADWRRNIVSRKTE